MSRANWKPLEEFVTSLYLADVQYCPPDAVPQFCSRFMFMGCSESSARTYYLYKEINTRKYLNLTSDSQPHTFIPGYGYKPISVEEALIHVCETI